MIKLWKWRAGRQEKTVYQKFPLWYFRIWKWGFDAYVLKYAPNTKLDWHKDPVKGGKHWRLNVKLKGFATFLIEKSNGCTIYFKRCIFFRPDIQEHKLNVYGKGCTKLSFGFVKYD